MTTRKTVPGACPSNGHGLHRVFKVLGQDGVALRCWTHRKRRQTMSQGLEGAALSGRPGKPDGGVAKPRRCLGIAFASAPNPRTSRIDAAHDHYSARLLAITAVASVAVAIGSDAAPARAQSTDLEQVTYLLPAPPFLPAFGPWMLAKARGYYADEGLDVEFQAAKGGVDVAKQVGAGNAVVGGAIGDTPIIVRANGIPVKSVALLGGRSLTQLVALEDSGINGPKDLDGRTVTTMSYQDTTYYALLGALASVGLDKSEVDIQAAGPAGVWKLFLAGEADAMSAVPDWIGIAQGQGKAVKIMPIENYFKSMAQAILASDETIANQPELIGKLVRATLQGMKDIMDDPAGAAADYVKAVPQHEGKEKAMEAVFRLYNEYVYPGQDQLGAIDAERLAVVQDFYVDQGIVTKKTPVDELYTNQFVE